MPDLLETRPRPTPRALVAAAAPLLTAHPETRIFNYASWQDEAWGFYRDLGEFGFAVTWMANAMSRVRLLAAEAMPGGDEPEPLTEGPAADLMAEFGGDVTRQAAMMAGYSTQMEIPGEAWTVAEDYGAGPVWCVKSNRELRPARSPEKDDRGRTVIDEKTGRPRYSLEVRVDDNVWRPIAANSLAFRTWNPDQEFSWKPYSAARAAISTMRKIDLYDRHIIATLVSRLAMNGFLIIPDEVVFAARPEFKDAPDPFIAEIIEFASRNIKNPGSASAAIPFPIKIPAEHADAFRHLAIANGVSKELLDARQSELQRLAAQMHMPQEILTGTGGTSHWNSFQIEESAIKMFISPRAELIVGGITTGYLRPALARDRQPLVGPNGYPIICWYDTSELTVKPDRTEAATQLYDRLELSGEALRREAGFAETDKPEPDALKDMALKKIVAGGDVANTAAAYKELTGEDLGDQSATPPGAMPGLPGAPAVPEQTVAPGVPEVEVDTTRTAPPTRTEPPPTDTSPPVRQAASRAVVMAHLSAARVDREAPTNGHVLVLADHD